MVDELKWSSLEAGIGLLCFFSNTYIVVLSVEKDKYLTPAHSSKITRSFKK